MRYAPGGSLECPHCGTTQAIPDAAQAPVAPMDYRAALSRRLPETEMEETRVLSCDSCGAQVEFDVVTHAKECPFCAAAIVTDTGTHRHIKPRGVLPFALSEKQARAAMAKWLGKLWFAPNGLQDYARKGRPLQGIYLPYWAYDARTASQYRGARGDAYYVTRTRRGADGKTETYRERRVRWTPVTGRVRRDFKDVLVLASKSLPRSYTEALEPWDLADLRSYTPDFLAGFRAEGYAIDLEEGFGLARAKMDAVIQRDVRQNIGGDEQRVDRIDTDTRDEAFKHILLPVWMAVYRFRGTPYRCVINGRTGRVQGQRPWSAGKIALAVLLAVLLAGGFGYLMAVQEGTAPPPF